MIILITVYAYQCFTVFGYEDGEEKKKVLQREKEQDEEWIIEKEQGTEFTEYDMYRIYASNIDRVSIRLEKLELN